MKYLITESRLESSIVKYIKGRYPQVEAVGFSHDRIDIVTIQILWISIQISL